MVATGLLLSITVLAVWSQPWTVYPRKVVGLGRALSQPAPVTAQKPDKHGDLKPDPAGDQAADPVRLRIPAIGVDAPVDPLTVDGGGILPPPTTNDRTGWWRDGPEPGERGPAVIVGHVDSYKGPAVFVHLADLSNGDQIFVDRADGTTAAFITVRVEQHAKDAFPTQAVYGGTSDPELRLITCGGQFDFKARRYLDNVIVYATRSS
ncbi:MAG TPA: class F sortase [Mycobacteriales bacterium]|jgi:sortase (surface protein transpeptidase)